MCAVKNQETHPHTHRAEKKESKPCSKRKRCGLIVVEKSDEERVGERKEGRIYIGERGGFTKRRQAKKKRYILV